MRVNTRLNDGKIRTYEVEANTIEEAYDAVKSEHPKSPVIVLVPEGYGKTEDDFEPEVA